MKLDLITLFIFKQIFNKSNVTLLLWFLAAYILVYFFIKMWRNTSPKRSYAPRAAKAPVVNVNTGLPPPPPTNRNMTGGSMPEMNRPSFSETRIFDILIFSILAIWLLITYFTKTKEEKENAVESAYKSIKEYVSSPVTLFSVTLFLFVFYFAIYLIGIPMDSVAKPYSVRLIEIIAWIVFVVVIIVSFFKYVLKINVTDAMDKAWGSVWKQYESDKANVAAQSAKVEPPKPPTEEVFNIATNIYTYDDAQQVCSVYGARLANYDDIEKSYENGGEWCNYGWSEGQTAYFPTQKDTWNKLQKTKSHKNDCGRPGVNGGYIHNPNVRFGVNCFGVKPKAKKEDLEWMNAQDPTARLSAKTPHDKFLEAKVKFWKDHSDKMLKINSFNRNKWTEY
jgi:hypothetical protein